MIEFDSDDFLILYKLFLFEFMFFIVSKALFLEYDLLTNGSIQFDDGSI